MSESVFALLLSIKYGNCTLRNDRILRQIRKRVYQDVSRPGLMPKVTYSLVEDPLTVIMNTVDTTVVNLSSEFFHLGRLARFVPFSSSSFHHISPDGVTLFLTDSDIFEHEIRQLLTKYSSHRRFIPILIRI